MYNVYCTPQNNKIQLHQKCRGKCAGPYNANKPLFNGKYYLIFCSNGRIVALKVTRQLNMFWTSTRFVVLNTHIQKAAVIREKKKMGFMMISCPKFNLYHPIWIIQLIRLCVYFFFLGTLIMFEIRLQNSQTYTCWK